jgi:dihydrodipicolinate synthase/N-acetylneuraminate lyase
VSALASAFPERVAAAVREPGGDEAAVLGELRAGVERYPRHAALKRIVAQRGVPIREDVRAPLRGLTDDERTELDRWLESL